MTAMRRWSQELRHRLTRARQRDTWRREATAVALLVIVGIALGVIQVEEEVAIPSLVIVYALTWLPALISGKK